MDTPMAQHLGQGIRNRSTNAAGGASDNGHLRQEWHCQTWENVGKYIGK